MYFLVNEHGEFVTVTSMTAEAGKTVVRLGFDHDNLVFSAHDDHTAQAALAEDETNTYRFTHSLSVSNSKLFVRRGM